MHWVVLAPLRGVSTVDRELKILVTVSFNLLRIAGGAAKVDHSRYVDVRLSATDVGPLVSESLTASRVKMTLGPAGPDRMIGAGQRLSLCVWLSGSSEWLGGRGTAHRFGPGDLVAVEGDQGIRVRNLSETVLAEVGMGADGAQTDRSVSSGALAGAQPAFRIYGDDAGETHIQDLDGPDRAGGFESSAAAVQFVSVPRAKANRDWHAAPNPRLVLWVSGCSEIEVTDGGRRPVEPGTAFLVDDTGSRGHRNHHHGDIRVMFVHLPGVDQS